MSNVTVDGVICQANDNNFTLQGNIKGMRVNNFHFERNVGIRLKPNVPGRSPNNIVFDHGIFSKCLDGDLVSVGHGKVILNDCEGTKAVMMGGLRVEQTGYTKLAIVEV